MANPFESLQLQRPASRSGYTPMPFHKVAIFGFTSGESMISVRRWNPETSRLAERGDKVPYFEGTLVTVRFPREWYEKVYDENGVEVRDDKPKAPLCRSSDGVYGNPSSARAWMVDGYTGVCSTCVLGEFGGDCKPAGIVFMMDESTGDVYWVRITTTSVGSLVKFLEESSDTVQGARIRISTEDENSGNQWKARFTWEIMATDVAIPESLATGAIAALKPHLEPSVAPVMPALPARTQEPDEPAQLNEGKITWGEEY